jgi:hypothetical protein
LEAGLADEQELLDIFRSLAGARRNAALDMMRGMRVRPSAPASPAPTRQALTVTEERLEGNVKALGDWLRPMLMDEETWERNKEWYTRIFDSTPDALKEDLIHSIGRAVVQIIQSRGKDRLAERRREEEDTRNELGGE